MIETSELEVIRDHIHSMDTVFDVGAYIGEWSEAVLKACWDIDLHQFEPSIDSFNILSGSEKFKNAQQNNIALSNQNGTSEFFYYSTTPVLSSRYRRPENVEQQFSLVPNKYKVPTKTISSYCKEYSIERINFLKIDAEGSELDILKGCYELLDKKRIVNIQFEYGACFLDAGFSFEDIWEFLHQFNYVVCLITDKGLSPILNASDFTVNIARITGNCLAFQGEIQ